MTIKNILSQATFYTDNITYTLLKLHKRAIIAAAGVVAEIADPFCALIVDKDEVTLLIPSHLKDEFGNRLKDAEINAFDYRLITIDVELEPDLVGFMAVISRALADADVSILTFAAFSRDHFMVPADKFDIAIQTLEKLKEG